MTQIKIPLHLIVAELQSNTLKKSVNARAFISLYYALGCLSEMGLTLPPGEWKEIGKKSAVHLKNTKGNLTRKMEWVYALGTVDKSKSPIQVDVE